MGRLGARLVQAARRRLSASARKRRATKSTPPGDQHLDRFPDSVDTLAPDNDFVVALEHRVPIMPGIPYHTIAGDRGPRRFAEIQRRPGALLEQPSGRRGERKNRPFRSRSPRNQQAIVEVKRILKLHAQH